MLIALAVVVVQILGVYSLVVNGVVVMSRAVSPSDAFRKMSTICLESTLLGVFTGAALCYTAMRALQREDRQRTTVTMDMVMELVKAGRERGAEISLRMDESTAGEHLTYTIQRVFKSRSGEVRR